MGQEGQTEGQTELRVPEVCAGPRGWGDRFIRESIMCLERRIGEERKDMRATGGMLGIHFLFHN